MKYFDYKLDQAAKICCRTEIGSAAIKFLTLNPAASFRPLSASARLPWNIALFPNDAGDNLTYYSFSTMASFADVASGLVRYAHLVKCAQSDDFLLSTLNNGGTAWEAMERALLQHFMDATRQQEALALQLLEAGGEGRRCALIADARRALMYRSLGLTHVREKETQHRAINFYGEEWPMRRVGHRAINEGSKPRRIISKLRQTRELGLPQNGFILKTYRLMYERLEQRD